MIKLARPNRFKYRRNAPQGCCLLFLQFSWAMRFLCFLNPNIVLVHCFIHMKEKYIEIEFRNDFSAWIFSSTSLSRICRLRSNDIHDALPFKVYTEAWKAHFRSTLSNEQLKITNVSLQSGTYRLMSVSMKLITRGYFLIYNRAWWSSCWLCTF